MKTQSIFIPEKTTVTDITNSNPCKFVSPKGVKIKVLSQKHGNVYYNFGKKLFRVKEHLVHFITVLLLLLIINRAEACSKTTVKITPELQVKYNQLREKANAEGIYYKIICSYRTQKDQDQLYAKGRTETGEKVTWTRQSRHTEGVAFDVVIFKEDQISWKPEDYFKLGAIAKRLGLTWGGDWKVRDYGHFEIGGKDESIK